MKPSGPVQGLLYLTMKHNFVTFNNGRYMFRLIQPSLGMNVYALKIVCFDIHFYVYLAYSNWF